VKAMRGAEAAKSDLAEGYDLLRQRGEKLSQMQEDSEALMNDAGDYARMAKQLAGGTTGKKKGKGGDSPKPDRAAEVASRHADSDFKEMMKAKKGKTYTAPIPPAPVVSSSAAKRQPAAKQPQYDDDEDDARDNNPDKDDVNEDNILDMDLDQYLAKQNADDSSNNKSVASSVSASKLNNVRDGTRGDNSQDNASSGGDEDDLAGDGYKGGRGLLDKVKTGVKSGVAKGGKLVGDTVFKGGHALEKIVHSGQNIVGGIEKVSNVLVDKGKQNFDKVSHAVVGGVQKVAQTVGIDIMDSDAENADDELNESVYAQNNAASLAQRFDAEKENLDAMFSAYANIEFPKAEIDASTTTEDLKVLELLEAARLENLTLREKAIQFEYQMAKYNFFAAETARLQGINCMRPYIFHLPYLTIRLRR
jgi:hypothetical protein